MDKNNLNVYLAGEIHTDWRGTIAKKSFRFET